MAAINNKLSSNVCNNCRRLFRIGPRVRIPTRRISGEGQTVVHVEKLTGQHEGITVFSLDRPHVRNAINFDVLTQFRAAISGVRDDVNTKVVIVRSSAPRMFCAGADLKERYGLADDEYKRWSWTIRRMNLELEEVSPTTIAAVDGPAIGGGLELALACHLRVAASNAKMGLPETTLGIIPGAGGTQRLPRIVGRSRALELIYTGRILTPDIAKEKYGLVNWVVQQSEQGNAAYDLALNIAEQSLGLQKTPQYDVSLARMTTDT